jgi:hypothetical protein
MSIYHCPVCAYQMNEQPDDYAICPSCGTEFGYHDSNHSHSELRRNWLLRGAPWHSRVVPRPISWNPIQQLAALQINVHMTQVQRTERTVAMRLGDLSDRELIRDQDVIDTAAARETVLS